MAIPIGGNGGYASSSGATRPQKRPAYAIIIKQAASSGRPAIRVQGELPADFQFNLNSSWSAPFAEGIIHSDRLNMLAQLAGMKFSNQSFSSNFWTGSEDVSFTFPLVFLAENNAQDILDPIVSLVKMSLPTVDATTKLFQAPGPVLKLASKIKNSLPNSMQSLNSPAFTSTQLTIGSAVAPSNQTAADVGSSFSLSGALGSVQNAMQFEGKISLQIGQFMLIPDVVITDISKDVKVLMTPDNVPLQVTCSVSFKTHQTPSADDVASWFIGG